MNIIVHLIILFIFVFALLMLNIPHLESNQYIKQKLYIFFGIFLFDLLISIFVTIYRKCIVDIGKVVRNSLLTALIGTIAYSIYNDLTWSNSKFIPDPNNKVATNLTITIIITGFIAVSYFFEIIFGSTIPKMNDCLNNIYSK